MVLPVLPSPAVTETQQNCIIWLGLAHSTVVDVIRAIRHDGIFITPEALDLLHGLREWLFYNFNTERSKRRDRRRRSVCSARTRFCYSKYENVRKQLHHDTVANTISRVPPSPVSAGPLTTL
ncbi:E4 ORF 4 [Simian adenovirus 24]|uniref:13.2 kDa n=2 Tax=Human mastadenovirus E TaxID=130308 RepID=Q8UY65_9ADEN|nr:E4 ORF4 [Simian adenovirus 25]AAL35539.1 13.2 kDa [Simian adenovirus 25]AAS10459.1 E4 ORF 4 [Simian adenovirus 24]